MLLSLSRTQREELLKMHSQTHEKEKADKIKAILLASENKTVEEIAKILLLEKNQVEQILTDFNKIGIHSVLQNFKNHSPYLLLLSQEESLQRTLMHRLIPFGIHIIQLENIKKITENIDFKNTVVFIDDRPFKETEVLDIFRKIKTIRQTARCILLTKNTDITKIRNFIQIGFDSVLTSDMSYEIVAEKIKIFIEKIWYPGDRRHYIRIHNEQQQDWTIEFLLASNNTYVSGFITDLTMAGLAAIFEEKIINLLLEEETYHNCQINLKGKIIFSDCRLIRKIDNMAIFHFQKMRESFQNSLSEFIYHKTQSLLNHS